jgi:uncharacterized protein (DUF427 family)
VIGDQAVVDSTRARLVWEPGRVVPSYAVPAEDVAAEIAAAADGVAPLPADLPRLGDMAILDPGIPFAVHSTDGKAVTVRAGDGREAAGFRPRDPALEDYVILDFGAFDAWYEEDERNVSHPRDPFHRIDVVHSSRHVRIEAGGETLAESSRPYLLFETHLPARFYLPPEDVRTDRLTPTDTRTWCAYKGEASYWALGGAGDVAWTYRAPLREAAEVTDRIAFFNERVDVVVDGERLERPVTPWS